MNSVAENDNETTFETTISRGLFGFRRRKLIVAPAFIQFGKRKFEKSDIKAFRYGIKWIHGYKFTIGRDFQIFIQSVSGEKLVIKFWTAYGIRKNELSKIFVEVIEKIWNFYFQELSSSLIEQIFNGHEIETCNTKISQNGLKIEKNGILKKQWLEIKWDDVGTKEYQSYCAVFSKKDAGNINKRYDYKDDWNVLVLFSVVTTVLEILKSQPQKSN